MTLTRLTTLTEDAALHGRVDAPLSYNPCAALSP